MKLINLNSKKGIVNLFADYILERIDKQYESIIQVTDLTYFFLVYGITESTDILDLNTIKVDFINEYGELLVSNGYSKNLNIMDLITYDKKPIESKDRHLWVKLHNSDRPIYHPKILNQTLSSNKILSIDYSNELEYEVGVNSSFNTSVKFKTTELQLSSEFPYGYSLKSGRSLLYYSEYIMNQLFQSIHLNSIELYISNNKSSDGDQVIEVVVDGYEKIENSVKSIILDNFTFDFHQFESKLNDYNLCNDIKKPTESKPWLVKDVNQIDLLMI